MNKSIVKEKSYHFALSIIQLCQKLKSDREFELANQLLRSGTSIGANIEEAIAGQSRRDFISKMSIVLNKLEKQTIGSDYYVIQILLVPQILTY